MKNAAWILFCTALLLLSQPLRAQFSISGNDAAALRWNSITQRNFRVIYPVGKDSLAADYLRELEKNRPGVARSLGMAAGQWQKRPLQVLLHTQNAASNGMVTWAPSRMEFYTIPEWQNFSAMPWKTMLAIHEGRHAAQMQLGYRHVFMPFRYILGEMMPGAAAVYPGKLLLEGDAVVAETALGRSGRGRSAAFLNEYFYHFDTGDTRCWTAWRLGSYYKSAPNHYAWGYLTISGVRAAYDKPLFMADYFDYVSRRPYDPWPLRHAIRRVSGKKFNGSYPEIVAAHFDAWAADTLSRGPFMPAERISPDKNRLTEYSSPVETPDSIVIWVKKDLYHNPALTVLDTSGRERRLRGMSAYTGRLSATSGGLLLWNELRFDPRWGQRTGSDIRYYDTTSGRVRTLVRGGVHVNPCEGPDSTVVAVRYDEYGNASIDFFRLPDGLLMNSVAAPKGLQPVLAAYAGGVMYVSGICEDGCGIWSVDGDDFVEVLAPQPVQIEALRADGADLLFESDLNGTGEYYRLSTATGALTRLSSTKYGGTAFLLRRDGSLQQARYARKGTEVALTGAGQLQSTPADWSNPYHYRIADLLSAQEDSLAAAAALDTAALQEASGPVEKKRYIKGGHAIRFHSWAPLYVDVDAISNMSFENIRNIASLGAMGFFQNTMSTLSGYVGYKAARDANRKWFHSGHLNLTYSGLYPKFEAQLHVGERNSHTYFYKNDTLWRATTDNPSIRASLNTYVPFSWSRGNVLYGLIPQLTVNYTNDKYLGDVDCPENFINLYVGLGVRGYVMQPTPSACIYPRWGIGAQLQWASGCSYAYLYGYIPGICCGQGLKLSALAQTLDLDRIFFMPSMADIIPRGFTSHSDALMAVLYSGMKFTADYAIPFYMGDWRISEAFYCKRGIVTPHFDYGLYHDGSLWSAGATFEMEFGSFLWVRTPVSIGITASCNGGSLWSRVSKQTGQNKHFYIGATYNITLPNS